MARPSKYNEERAEAIVVMLQNGNTRKAACLANGISETTFATWLSRNLDFLDRVKRAEAEAEAEMVQVIRNASKDSWQAAAWYLERRNVKEWGRKDTLRLDRMKDDELLDFITGGTRDDGSGAPESRGDSQAARVSEDR